MGGKSQCSVVVRQSGEMSIDMFFKDRPILSELHIVSKDQSPISLNSSQYPITRLLKSDQLLSLISKANKDSNLKASTNSDNEFLDPAIRHNELILDGLNLKLYINEQSYKSIPSVVNIGTVKKLKDTKLGHGSKYHSSHSYLVCLNLTSGMKPEIEYILNTLFTICDITTNITTKLPVENIIPSTLVLNKVDLSSLYADISDLDLADLYEYLILINLNSPQLTSEGIDDYISTYQLPYTHSSATENKPLVLSRYEDVSSKHVHDMIKQDWLIINTYHDSGHTLLFKSPVSQTIVVWDVNR